MGIDIENAEAYTLASELTNLTGKSMTAVVIDALQAQLERLKQRQEQEEKVQELMAIGKRCAAHMQQPALSTAHGNLLYDELGYRSGAVQRHTS